MLFSGWEPIGRVLLVGVLAYAALVMLLRVFGKRTLSKMNAFDLVVTVALGSTLATILLSKETALAEGITAFALLIALQFVVSWSSLRAGWFSGLVKSEPALLLHRGEFLDDALRRERITRQEVLAAARAQGARALGEVAAVVLETDGSLSVVMQSDDAHGNSTLAGLREAGTIPTDRAP
ncbi:MAG TPA: YetF domain-containing protein [Gemmatimonadaceae bacterium]|nr:YetF domain-containing protein [Gemmatimonadaceae bacterium]